MEQLRLLYRNGDGGVAMNADFRSHRVFLFADQEVLSTVDAFLVKCVEADYEATDYVPRNARGGLGPHYYFGWMPTKVVEIVALWKELVYNDLESLAPRMIEGSSTKIWESVVY
jgi:hypothetical protein